MSVSYSLKGPLLQLDLTGSYDPEDVVRQFLVALDDPACPDPVALLVDVRQSDSLGTRSPAQIRYVAEFLGPHAKRINGRCALVATEDLHFGLGRMGSAYSEGVGVETQVFRDTDAAREWLGV